MRLSLHCWKKSNWTPSNWRTTDQSLIWPNWLVEAAGEVGQDTAPDLSWLTWCDTKAPISIQRTPQPARGCVENLDGQITTHFKCCCTSGNKNTKVRPRSDANSTWGFALVGRSWPYHIETVCFGVQVSPRIGAILSLRPESISPKRWGESSSTIRSTRTTSSLRPRLSTYENRAFAYAGPNSLNNLPDYLKDNEHSLATFTRLLKTFLFKGH